MLGDMCSLWRGMFAAVLVVTACDSPATRGRRTAASADATTSTTGTSAEPSGSGSAMAPATLAVPDAGVAQDPAGVFADFRVSDAGGSRVIGFSADDAYLGYEHSSCDPCPQEFDFVSPRRPPVHLSYLYDPANANKPDYEARRARNDAAVDAALKGLGAERQQAPFKLRGPFPYEDLVFAYKVERQDHKGIVLVHFGLRVRGDDAVFLVHLALGPHPLWNPSPELAATLAKLPPAEREAQLRDHRKSYPVRDPDDIYMNVSRDGSELGFVAVARGAMWIEMGDLARRDTKTLVAETYNETGLRHHKAGAYERSSVYFARAAQVQPDVSLFHYNAACAFARLGRADSSETSLRTAIKLGGAAVRARAGRDEDFAGVRHQDWFRKL